jgi:hypothetical protein
MNIRIKPKMKIDLFSQKILLILLFLFCQLIFSQKAGAALLSPESKISLLTISPGKELYNSFGHSVIRVQDKPTNIDYTFNYGTFDFQTPNFYLKFSQGKLKYSMSVSYFRDLKEYYQSENRSIYEQDLAIAYPERDAIYSFLLNNYLPENRYYSYDFFFDNCATRIRDVFQNILRNKLRFNTENYSRNKSFRDLIAENLGKKPWGELGIDLALGSIIDRTATPAEYMFLPKYLNGEFFDARIKENGGWQPLVEKGRYIFLADTDPQDNKFNNFLNILNPMVFFWGIFFIVSFKTYRDFLKQKISYKPDLVLFTLSGTLGIILFLLWFATDHSGTANNFNLIWAFPLHFPMVFMLMRKKRSALPGKYFLVWGVIMALLLVFWNFLPQKFYTAEFPLILTLTLRAFYIFKSQNWDLTDVKV